MKYWWLFNWCYYWIEKELFEIEGSFKETLFVMEIIIYKVSFWESIFLLNQTEIKKPQYKIPKIDKQSTTLLLYISIKFKQKILLILLFQHSFLQKISYISTIIVIRN